jgi:hypothetical protein
MLKYNTYDEAISALYMTMASASANTEVTSCICTILSDDGSLNKQEERILSCNPTDTLGLPLNKGIERSIKT